MILDEILEHKRSEVAARKSAIRLDELKARLADAPAPLDFAAPLARNANGIPAVIAEVKKASPSRGVIRPDFDPVAIARSYEAAGAAAISVLTDERFFQGSLDHLTAVKRAVNLPVLRKDFVIDSYQLFEARAAGADAVLLIVAALEAGDLVRLIERAAELGMASLVEVHDEAELQTALGIGTGLIGINNRNLHTFEVSLETTARLLSMAMGGGSQARQEASGTARSGRSNLPPNPLPTREGEPDVSPPLVGEGSGERFRATKLVSESGILTRDDMAMLGGLGVDAVLIGEALMRERDVEAKLRSLIE